MIDIIEQVNFPPYFLIFFSTQLLIELISARIMNGERSLEPWSNYSSVFNSGGIDYRKLFGDMDHLPGFAYKHQIRYRQFSSLIDGYFHVIDVLFVQYGWAIIDDCVLMTIENFSNTGISQYYVGQFIAGIFLFRQASGSQDNNNQ